MSDLVSGNKPYDVFLCYSWISSLISILVHLPAVLVARVVTEGLGSGQRCPGKA